MHRNSRYHRRKPALYQITILLLSLFFILSTAKIAFASYSPGDINWTIRSEKESISPYTIWIIGDSLTFGMFASSEPAAYRNLLFDSLREKHPGQIRSTFWSWVCTYAALERRWESWEGTPDMIFIELGINDLGRNPSCPQIPVEEWQTRVGAMFDRIQQDAPGVKIIVGTIPWSGWPPESQEFQDALVYNHWIVVEAKQRDIAVADLWAATVGKEDGISTPDQPSIFPPFYHGDNFHPSDLGHQRIANTFFDTYLNTLYSTYLPQVTHSFHYEQP